MKTLTSVLIRPNFIHNLNIDYQNVVLQGASKNIYTRKLASVTYNIRVSKLLLNQSTWLFLEKPAIKPRLLYDSDSVTVLSSTIRIVQLSREKLFTLGVGLFNFFYDFSKK